MQLKKKVAFNKYQIQQRDKNSQDQYISPPPPDLILNRLIEENLSKEHDDRIRKFPGATVVDLNHHVHPVPGKKPKYIIIHIETNDATLSASRKILATFEIENLH